MRNYLNIKNKTGSYIKIVFMLMITWISPNLCASEIDNLVSNAKDMLKDQSSVITLPNYSEISKDRVTEELNKIDPAELESSGVNIRNRDLNNPGSYAATLEEASSPSKVTGIDYSNLEMFLRGDKIMNDPVSLFNSLNAESCREIMSDKERHFTKRELLAEKTEIVEEIRSCEVPTNQFKCTKSLKLTCIAKDNCDFGGIIKESVASDMKLDYSGGILTIGTIADNYWDGFCKIYDRDTEFSIKNIRLLQEFKLVRTGFDDYIEIKINGTTVYIGPDGGSRLEVINGRVFDGHNYNSCELNINWDNTMNIDLKPYLVEGRNKISIRVIVTGRGEGWLQIAAKQHCCSSWHEEWVKSCD